MPVFRSGIAVAVAVVPDDGGAMVIFGVVRYPDPGFVILIPMIVSLLRTATPVACTPPTGGWSKVTCGAVV